MSVFMSICKEQDMKTLKLNIKYVRNQSEGFKATPISVQKV